MNRVVLPKSAIEEHYAHLHRKLDRETMAVIIMAGVTLCVVVFFLARIAITIWS